jgi:hypothetical protein
MPMVYLLKYWRQHQKYNWAVFMFTDPVPCNAGQGFLLILTERMIATKILV